MLTGYLPKFTLPSRESDDRRGDGVAIICDGVSMLIDGFEGGEPTNRMMTWLANKGVSDIDIAVLTHGHYDHYHGLQLIEEDKRFHIKTLYCYNPETLRHGVDNTANGRAVKSDIANMYNFIRTMQSHGTKVIYIDDGGQIKCGGLTWNIYRKQPRTFNHLDGGHAYAFLNDGSLILHSPEIRCMFGGDGPGSLADAIKALKAIILFYDISHHGNSCPQSDALALKIAGCILAWQSCIERNGIGTTDWTEFGSRRVKEQGITVWQQDADVTFVAGGGRITFMQGNKTITAAVPYEGSTKEGWVEDKNGKKYQYADGTFAIGWHWFKLDNAYHWFYFDYTGYAVSGWKYLKYSDGKWWFFFDFKTKEMKVGWHKLPWGKGQEDWFYLDPKIGTVVYGWQYLKKGEKNGWFYLDDKNGNMHTGWVFVNKYWYYLDENGFMQTGWLNRKGLFYLEPVSGKNQGHAYRNQTAVIDGKTWRFNDMCYAYEVKTTGNITSVSGKLNDISASRKQFAIDIANYVRKYAPQYGINVYSPVIAQAIHESGWGESKLSAKYHNYFGLKCGTKWTGKSVNMSTQEEYSAGTLTTISANFRAYDSMEEGVKGYFEFIQLPRYSNLKGITSPRKYLETIIADGYATGKQYVDHVMNLINLYNLTQFDVAVAPVTTPTEPKKTDSNPVDVLLSIASAEVGYHEGANNKNKYGDELHKIQPSNMNINAAWCDAFADWTVLKMCEAFGYGADMAREVLCGDFDDYTYASINLYKKQGRWASSPARGYQIFFGGSGHTGWVENVDSKIHTIEGNKSDQVMRCTYVLNDSRIIGYGMPKYELLAGGLTAENMPLIKKGSTGFAVVELQKRLNAISYKGKVVLTVDGDFGDKTYNAVKAYQSDRGLNPVDGEVGKITWKSLFDEV